MILNVKGTTARPIPWGKNERATKKYSIMIDRIPGGFVVAIPAVYFSTIVMDYEHRLVARNRIERPLRASFDLSETKELAKLIMDNLK